MEIRTPEKPEADSDKFAYYCNRCGEASDGPCCKKCNSTSLVVCVKVWAD
jgi:hypothetical protein